MAKFAAIFEADEGVTAEDVQSTIEQAFEYAGDDYYECLKASAGDDLEEECYQTKIDALAGIQLEQVEEVTEQEDCCEEDEEDEEDESEEQEYRVTVEYIGEEDYEDLAEDDHMCCDSYFYTGTDEDDVLDKFHDDHPCGNLELYEITVEPCDEEEVTEPEDYWAEDKDYPAEDWIHEVRDGYTRLGYWEWVKDRKTQDEEDGLTNND